jgi:hypothetical protein
MTAVMPVDSELSVQGHCELLITRFEISSANPRFRCEKCKLLLWNPHILPNGERVCGDCTLTCSIDGTISNPSDIIADVELFERVQNHRMECPFSDECLLMINAIKLHSHYRECHMETTRGD